MLKTWWQINELASQFPRATEVIDRALLNLSRKPDHPMGSVHYEAADMPYVLFCPAEFMRVQLRCMKDMGLLQFEETVPPNSMYITLLPKGWEKVESLNSIARESKQGFVAMWFSPEMEGFFNQGIVPGVNDAGFECKRIDGVEHINKICDEIVAEIRKSRFVVADFTAGCCKNCPGCEHNQSCPDKVRARGGVYFEAGLALGLGIPVIWTIRKDQIDQVHFDTRQYNHIVYETPEELRERLKNRIAATIH
ncbi:MAG: hypothetical protein NTV86_13790 [Planctomycetota bacterium]|nr:hypothetical protein [Planctomycetota bacterium]